VIPSYKKVVFTILFLVVRENNGVTFGIYLFGSEFIKSKNLVVVSF
jgi:hypothetical protein